MRPAPPPDPSGLVLLVIDVQNGFATYGDERDRKPGYVDTASSHVPAIAAFCRRWLQSGLPLVVARFCIHTEEAQVCPYSTTAFDLPGNEATAALCSALEAEISKAPHFSDGGQIHYLDKPVSSCVCASDVEVERIQAKAGGETFVWRSPLPEWAERYGWQEFVLCGFTSATCIRNTAHDIVTKLGRGVVMLHDLCAECKAERVTEPYKDFTDPFSGQIIRGRSWHEIAMEEVAKLPKGMVQTSDD